MTRTLMPLALGLVTSFFYGQAFGVTAPQLEAIQSLGNLNGIALQCRYFEQTQGMKKALIAALPKRRQLGQTFDDATNQAFLRFIEQKLTCPPVELFNQQVAEGIKQLNTVFTK